MAFNVTLDNDHADFLEMMVKTGKYGRSRNDVAAQILRLWLGENAAETVRKHKELLQQAREEASGSG